MQTLTLNSMSMSTYIAQSGSMLAAFAKEKEETRMMSISNIFKVKVKVIEMSMSMYAKHKSTVMPSLHVIA